MDFSRRWILAPLLLVAACKPIEPSVVGGNEPLKQRYQLPSVTQLDSRGPFNIDVSTKKGPSGLWLDGPRWVVEDTIVGVRGHTLYLNQRHALLHPSQPPITVHVQLPHLSRVHMAGHGTFKIKKLLGHQFSADLSRGAQLKLAGAVDELHLTVQDGSAFKAENFVARRAVVVADDAAKINFKLCDCPDATITQPSLQVEGHHKARIVVHGATQRLRATLSGRAQLNANRLVSRDVRVDARDTALTELRLKTARDARLRVRGRDHALVRVSGRTRNLHAQLIDDARLEAAHLTSRGAHLNVMDHALARLTLRPRPSAAMSPTVQINERDHAKVFLTGHARWLTAHMGHGAQLWGHDLMVRRAQLQAADHAQVRLSIDDSRRALPTDIVRVDVTDRARVLLTGQARQLDARVKQKARLDARTLIAQRAYVRTTETAVAKLNVADTLNAVATQASDIYYCRDPKHLVTFNYPYGAVLRLPQGGAQCPVIM